MYVYKPIVQRICVHGVVIEPMYVYKPIVWAMASAMWLVIISFIISQSPFNYYWPPIKLADELSWGVHGVTLSIAPQLS